MTTPRAALAFARRVTDGDGCVKHIADATASALRETLGRAGVADLGIDRQRAFTRQST
jgi:hypothetical protein